MKEEEVVVVVMVVVVELVVSWDIGHSYTLTNHTQESQNVRMLQGCFGADWISSSSLFS